MIQLKSRYSTIRSRDKRRWALMDRLADFYFTENPCLANFCLYANRAIIVCDDGIYAFKICYSVMP